MTSRRVPEESRRQEKENSSHTRSSLPLPRPSAAPPLPSPLLQRRAEAPGGGEGAGSAVLLLASSLGSLHLPSSCVCSSLPPALVGTSAALGSPRSAPRLAPASQFPGKPLTAQAGQEANVFVSPGTGLQERGFSSSDTSPSSPSAGPARCSAISQRSESRPV